MSSFAELIYSITDVDDANDTVTDAREPPA